MIYLEPAPYIVALAEEVRARLPQTDLLFASASLTQTWEQRPGRSDAAVLPPSIWLALFEVWRRVRRADCDVLHLGGWGHPLLFGALLIGRLLGVPVTVESDTPPRLSRSRLRTAIKRIVYPMLFRLPAVFLPGGTPQAAYIRRYGVDDSRIRVVMMSVDVEQIRSTLATFGETDRTSARLEHGIHEHAVVFLHVGRLEPEKGIEDLLNAFARLAAGREDVALVIVGDGSLRGDVVRAAARDGRIHYLGRHEGDALWETYALADVFVLPSRFERWGLVVNEAMAAGLPVIATDVAGCVPDLVAEGENGLIVPSRSPEALSCAMATLAADLNLRRAMAAASVSRISGRTVANQARRTIAAWHEAARCER